MSKTIGKATDLITFSRSSKGTALRKVAYGPELVTNGTFDRGISGWTDTSSVGGAIAWDASGYLDLIYTTANARAEQTMPVEVGKTYIVSAEIITASGLNYGVYVGTPALSSAYGLFANAGGAGVRTFTFVATSETLRLQAIKAGGGEFKLDNVSVKEVTFDQGDLTLFNHPADIPRIEYDASGNVLGLLVEEARTNLVTYSEDFSGPGRGWAVQSDAVLTGNRVTSPAGDENAYAITISATNTSAVFASAITGVGTYTVSAWLKVPSGTADLRIGFYNVTDGLLTQAITVTDEWQRFSFTATVSAASNAYPLLQKVTPNYIGDVYIYGAQVEAGAFSTSYIPTNGATATRAADVASIATSEFGYRADEGTVVVECNYSSGSDVDPFNRAALVMDDGTADNRILIYNRTSYANSSFVAESGNTQAAINGLAATDAFVKTALAVSQDDFAACSNGGSVGVDSAGLVPPITRCGIGCNVAGATFLNGHIKSIKYYPRRLLNNQLVEVTS